MKAKERNKKDRKRKKAEKWAKMAENAREKTNQDRKRFVPRRGRKEKTKKKANPKTPTHKQHSRLKSIRLDLRIFQSRFRLFLVAFGRQGDQKGGRPKSGQYQAAA